ncbi:MAG: hypothetical protein ACREJB_01215, partial [Planctomycetaceae bacterium]
LQACIEHAWATFSRFNIQLSQPPGLRRAVNRSGPAARPSVPSQSASPVESEAAMRGAGRSDRLLSRRDVHLQKPLR